MKFRMMKIELPVPAEVDPSDVLARVHELAAELIEDHPDLDDEGEEEELDSETKEAVENAVSVTDAGVIKFEF